jgi:hypothetical protein
MWVPKNNLVTRTKYSNRLNVNLIIHFASFYRMFLRFLSYSPRPMEQNRIFPDDLNYAVN